MPNPEKNWRSYLSKLTSAAIDELAPLLSRKLVAQSASLLLPQQSFNRTRTALVRAAGAHIGAHSQIQGPIRFTGLVDTCELLTIGDHTVITGHLHCDLGAEIRIGSRVRIGHDVSLLTVSHAFEHEWLRSGTSEASPIEIGDGAWIASRVTILPKVRIGAGAVVAAGAVVTRDVPPNTLVGGVPARVIRPLQVDGQPPTPTAPPSD